MRNLLDAGFAHPRGLLGRLGGALMARATTERNTWTLSLLSLPPGAHVLEIGFGPGALIQALAASAPSVSVEGVDPSPVMLRQATGRNQQAIAERRVHLQLGSALPLPFADATFTTVLSANSIFFWPDPEASLREIHRVLAPAGTMALILQPIWAKTDDEVRTLGAEYAERLTTAGFQHVHVVFKSMRPKATVCVLGNA
jgi:ubiquinone/menaquinone biosynthesis C-methylase UbiE